MSNTRPCTVLNKIVSTSPISVIPVIKCTSTQLITYLNSWLKRIQRESVFFGSGDGNSTTEYVSVINCD